ncbi:hypothetical protein AB0J19_37595, partial [Streptomyces microflavus]
MKRIIARMWKLIRGPLQWRILWFAHAKFMIELLRDGHRSGDGLRSATNKTPELLIEMSDVS